MGVALGACLVGTVAGLLSQHRVHKRRLQGLRDQLAAGVGVGAAGAETVPVQYGLGQDAAGKQSRLQTPAELGNTPEPTLFELGGWATSWVILVRLS